MKKILAFCCMFVALHANACLNIFSVDSAGHAHVLNHQFLNQITFPNQNIKEQLARLERAFDAGKYDTRNISDYGAYLLMDGQFAEGLIIFRALSKKHSNWYEIVANTAVAYELNGNVDSALYWQKKALEINWSAHYNSEWIHINILKAKQELAKDSNWCLKNNITGIVDSIKRSAKDEYGQGLNFRRDNLYENFIVQLNERIPFSYGHDPVLGKLMYELGEAYRAVSMYRAYYCFALAKYFYPSLDIMAGKQMQKIKSSYPSAATTKQLATKVPASSIKTEMQAPKDSDVASFIQKMDARNAIKRSHKIKISIAELLTKI